jgi:PKD repeat protein
MTIVVSNDPTVYSPSAMISASVLSGFAPLTVTFSATVAASATVSYLWDFGDGSTSTLASPPSHTYRIGGVYTVTLTVTDEYGQTSSTVQIVVGSVFYGEAPGGGTPPTGRPYYYIIDKVNETVLIYDIAGTFLASFGGHGVTTGKFIKPTTLVLVSASLKGDR